MQILCIGSAVLDITAGTIGPGESWQEKQRIEQIQIQPGGDAVNQCTHMAALGMKPMLVACVGKDTNGSILEHGLQERGIDTTYVQKVAGATGTAMVLVGPEGVRNTFSVKGAHSLLSKGHLPKVLPAECKAISLASLFSMPLLEQDGLEEFLQSLHGAVHIFADLAADKLGQGLKGIKRFLPYIDYFLPSDYDAMKMTGKATVEEAAAVFQNCGAANVIIKCGAKGCYCLSQSFTGWIPAVKVEPIDTTGAGDCFVGVFITKMLSGHTVKAAAEYACGAAGYSTLFHGASAVKLSEERIAAVLRENTYEGEGD